MTSSFSTAYPNLTWFVTNHGWIEIGYDENTNTFARALDEGGWVYQGKDSYSSLDAAFTDLEQGIVAWMEANGVRPTE